MAEHSQNLDVLVIGSCITDLITYTKRMPKVGETIHGYKFAVGCGGKGGNQCVAAAKLGASTAIVAKLGVDSFGEAYLRNLQEIGVDTSHVKTVHDSTGVAQITVSDNGDNHIIIVVGANNSLSRSDVEEAENSIRTAKVVLFQFETPLSPTIRALELCSKYSCIAVVNGAPGVTDLDPLILQLCDIFCVNETEAELTTKIQVQSVADAEKAATVLKSMGCKLPVITLGALGVVFIGGDDCERPVHIPVEPVKATDTTGAGDAFLGGLAYFLAKYPQLSTKDAIKRACEVAKYSVQKPGTQISFPYKTDLPRHIFE